MRLIVGLVKVVLGLAVLVIVVAVAGAVYVMAVPSKTAQCPAVTATGATTGSIGDTLASRNVVDISNGDATAIGNQWVGSVVDDLRVCFDPRAGHASGELKLGPAQIPFYLSATGADLSGSHPQVQGLSFQVGSLPGLIVDPAQSILTSMVNDNLGRIELNRKYTSKFASGKVTIQAP